MVKIYRMWRYVRIVENELFRRKDEMSESPTTTYECGEIFQKKRTLFRRNYSVNENVKAAYMAEKFRYIELKKGIKDGEEVHFVGISGEGLTFTSLSSLLNEWAGAVGKIPPVATLIVSLLAIAISIIALNAKH